MVDVVHICHSRGDNHVRAGGYCGTHQQATTPLCAGCGAEADTRHRCAA